jgi:hypothetical protein
VGLVPLFVVTFLSSLSMAGPGDALTPIEEIPSASFEIEERQPERTPPAPAPPPAATRPPSAPTPPPPAVSRPQHLDYRLQLVLADLGALSLMLASGPVDGGLEEPLEVAGLGVYAFGGAAIHLVHGQPIRALASTGMRVGFPLIGALPGLLLYSTCDRGGPSDPDTDEENGADLGCIIVGGLLAVVGGTTGYLTAIVVDDAILGKVPLHQVNKKQTQGGRARMRVSAGPLVDPRKKVLGLSLRGSF